MTDTTLSKINRFLKELAEVVAAPSGDARGHVRDYRPKPAPRDRL
jgi:hypothetical protein